jgi:hypothetical protein
VFHQAVVIAGGNAPLSAAQLAGASLFTSNAGVVTASTTAGNAGTLQANISDDQGAAVAAKYAWEQFKFFAGYDFEQATNPHDNLGIGATNDQGGYILSTVNNFAYPHAKILQTEWTGVRYAYDPRTEIAFSLYHTGQNQYGTAAQDATCSAKTQRSKAPQCAGGLYAGSLYVDYHFTKRLDAYGGVEVSNVEGGLASGFNYYTNWAPTAGVRYSF